MQQDFSLTNQMVSFVPMSASATTTIFVEKSVYGQVTLMLTRRNTASTFVT
jgi:hypothetical protein